MLDLDTDEYVEKIYQTESNSVIIVEGVLLYRPPLDGLFDYKIFLDVSFDEVLRRARERDVPKYGEEFLKKYTDRYIPAQKIYLNEYAPKEQSQCVIDNNDCQNPIVVNIHGQLKIAPNASLRAVGEAIQKVNFSLYILDCRVAN